MCVLRDGKPICDGRAHHSVLHGQAEAILQKQTGPSALRRFGQDALRCENHVIFGNRKQGEVRKCFLGLL